MSSILMGMQRTKAFQCLRWIISHVIRRYCNNNQEKVLGLVIKKSEFLFYFKIKGSL
jgi:hypothetical protein